MARTVRDLLASKQREVWTLSADASVYDALALMAAKEIGSLVATHGNEVVGIITERDYARKVILRERSSRATLVREIMTERVFYVQPDQPIEDCVALMTEQHIRHLPVFDQDRLVGLISIGDIVKEAISDKEFPVDPLTRHISGEFVH